MQRREFNRNTVGLSAQGLFAISVPVAVVCSRRILTHCKFLCRAVGPSDAWEINDAVQNLS